MELIENEGGFVGVINTRGFEKNTVFGCDFIVTGSDNGEKLSLKKRNVRRGVNMSSDDCEWFQELDLRVQKTNSGEQLKGLWVWISNEADQLSLVRSQDSVSEITKDEITAYVEETYRMYEENNVLLPIIDRLNHKAGELAVDSGDIVLDFSIDSTTLHDSITVVFNGQVISEFHDFKRSPLRIRLKELTPGNNDIIVISQSVAQNKLTLQLVVKHGGMSHQFSLTPGFTRNELLFLYRKQE